MQGIHQQTDLERLNVAIDSLVFVLSSDDGVIRRTVRSALVAVGEPAVPALSRAVKNQSRIGRWEAAKTLGSIHSPAAVPALVSALEDPAFGVRWSAADGLIRMGRDGIRAVVKALVEKPAAPWIRDGAHHVLRSVADHALRDLVVPLVRAIETNDTPARVAELGVTLLDGMLRDEVEQRRIRTA
jgi:HEAT repeat protein